MLTNAERMDRFIELTVSFLKIRHVESIRTYKDFLNFTPLFEDRKKILSAALEKLFDTDIVTLCWLLEHQDLLRPEVDVKSFIDLIINTKLSPNDLMAMAGNDNFVCIINYIGSVLDNKDASIL